MKRHDKLDSFYLVCGKTIVSPALTTTREYGAWFASAFDNYTSGQELYCKSKAEDGTSVLESHPGTRIGKFFDTHEFQNHELNCWYIKSDSPIVKQLVQRGLADINDCITNRHGRVLRVYTVRQIELYLQTTIDKKFRIGGMLLPSKKIQVDEPAEYIMPAHKVKKKRLF